MFDSEQIISSSWRMYTKKLLVAFTAIALAILVWTNLLVHINIDANAATIKPLHLAVTAEGIGDKIEGKAQKDIGTVQRNVGKATGQAEGALNQAKGKAKQDIGTVKNKLDDAGDKAENASENFVDSVKDFFN